jgi:glycerol-3-phosphate dehydrogenase (NAD(P)+)
MPTQKKIAVIGDGGWGTALALIALENGHAVTLWGPFESYIQEMRDQRRNDTYLAGVALPEALNLTSDRAEALQDADAVILAVPTKYFHDVVGSLAGLIPPTIPVVSVAKGLDRDSHERMSAVAARLLNHTPVAALSGPSHAEEVARGVPTAVTIACTDTSASQALQGMLANSHFRIYTSDDVVGVELGGALKNVIAIAVGVSDGLGFGDNTRAALITRGLVEMTRLGMSLGAHATTFSGLSGMGDLIVTCTSKLSRNRAVGERIGRGESIDDILGGMKQAAEGVWNCASAYALAGDQGIAVPVTAQVHAIIHEGKAPRDAVRDLLGRELGSE